MNDIRLDPMHKIECAHMPIPQQDAQNVPENQEAPYPIVNAQPDGQNHMMRLRNLTEKVKAVKIVHVLIGTLFALSILQLGTIWALQTKTDTSISALYNTTTGRNINMQRLTSDIQRMHDEQDRLFSYNLFSQVFIVPTLCSLTTITLVLPIIRNQNTTVRAREGLKNVLFWNTFAGTSSVMLGALMIAGVITNMPHLPK